MGLLKVSADCCQHCRTADDRDMLFIYDLGDMRCPGTIANVIIAGWRNIVPNNLPGNFTPQAPHFMDQHVLHIHAAVEGTIEPNPILLVWNVPEI